MVLYPMEKQTMIHIIPVSIVYQQNIGTNTKRSELTDWTHSRCTRKIGLPNLPFKDCLNLLATLNITQELLSQLMNLLVSWRPGVRTNDS